MSAKMHSDEIDIDADLVQRLLAAQFPRWADLPLTRFPSGGTVNAIFRLGDDLCVRLPLTQPWAWHLDTEVKWLPRLAPHVPFATPTVHAKGSPAEDYPFNWAVLGWLDGEPWRPDRLRDEGEAAVDLARFISALSSIDTAHGKIPRGAAALPLRARDGWVRTSIDGCRDLIDADALTAAWDEALQLPDFDGPPRWVHADLLRGNVIVGGGCVTAVIDWGAVHVGDPARDLVAAWTLLTSEGRRVFRETLEIDDATWARARGWCIPQVGAIPYYRETNQAMVDGALCTVNEILLDAKR